MIAAPISKEIVFQEPPASIAVGLAVLAATADAARTLGVLF